ncbi:PrsW family intramembrane metalloprotease [Listeria sp. FSL L7-1582]|uniref:PrsW family glutamic-type intramembrane protease n=1 Tax=Listeria portnoyi TaxID=2713504 RepID=UPI00164E3624|nr:PrsW family glutamic-type intramembrane protease [Listeria portnoyi]MBC6309354.1 PrsW family intramembrane metalloprotease [Listeria portnoyi]
MSHWYFQKNDKTIGPLTDYELRTLYKRKELTAETRVKQEVNGEWLFLKDSPIFQTIHESHGPHDASKGPKKEANHHPHEKNGAQHLGLGDIFADVFKKHPKTDSEKVFIAGTTYTTPNEGDIASSWTRPFLFSRVFFALAITYLLLLACTYMFSNSNTIPGLMVIGSFTMPFSVLVLFFEINAPRNISFFDVLKMFFIGGVAALVATLILYEVIPVGQLNYFNAFLVGIIEETGKMVIVALFIVALKPKYILNGLLIGAAVGAGFAAFESLGYAFNYSIEVAAVFKNLQFAGDTMLNIIFSRGWQSIGGHVVWAAISGAALMIAKGSDPKLQMRHIFTGRFLSLFIIPIGLHFLWDCPWNPLPQIAFKQILLIVVVWIVIFSLINKGLRQISGKKPAKA